MKRFLFYHSRTGIKYELKGRDEHAMLRHCIAEGITEANGWRLIQEKPRA